MKYHKQETNFSCGASAIRNVFKAFGVSLTEKYLRKLLGTDSKGTDEFSLLMIGEDYGFKTKEVKSKSIEVFKRKVIKDLKDGYKLILAVDNYSHWIAVMEYKDRRIEIIDSRYHDDLGKKIKQYVTVKQLADRSHNYDIETNVKEFYYIGLLLKDE